MLFQACAGPDLKIYDIVCRYPGSTHDATIFNNSTLKIRLQSGMLQGLLLGDKGYPCKEYLLTPLHVARTLPEERYNSALCQTRNTVERTFGVWKRKFPCLKRTLATKLRTTTAIIIATAILHNIHRQYAVEEDEEEEHEENDAIEDVVHRLEARNASGLAFRDTFIQNEFS